MRVLLNRLLPRLIIAARGVGRLLGHAPQPEALGLGSCGARGLRVFGRLVSGHGQHLALHLHCLLVCQGGSLFEVGIQLEGRRVQDVASRWRDCTCSAFPIILDGKSALAEPLILPGCLPAGCARVVIEDFQEVLPSKRLFHLPRVYDSHYWKRLFRDIHGASWTFWVFSLLYLPEKVFLGSFLNNLPELIMVLYVLRAPEHDFDPLSLLFLLNASDSILYGLTLPKYDNLRPLIYRHGLSHRLGDLCQGFHTL